jgi:hypothetical protein
MFTGEWDDARSAKQRQLDYERELASGTQLTLFSQPPVAENELTDKQQVERVSEQGIGEPNHADLLFDASILPSELSIDHALEPAANEREKPNRSPYDLYLELVMLCEEQAETIWIDPLYADEYLFEIAGLLVVARNAGLSTAELQAAIQIGTWRGTQRKREYENGANTPKAEGERVES